MGPPISTEGKKARQINEEVSQWIEAAKRHLDFGLNVSSELSEERSSEESEEMVDPNEPGITIKIGYDLEGGMHEEEIEHKSSESEIETHL